MIKLQKDEIYMAVNHESIIEYFGRYDYSELMKIAASIPGFYDFCQLKMMDLSNLSVINDVELRILIGLFFIHKTKANQRWAVVKPINMKLEDHDIMNMIEVMDNVVIRNDNWLSKKRGGGSFIPAREKSYTLNFKAAWFKGGDSGIIPVGNGYYAVLNSLLHVGDYNVNAYMYYDIHYNKRDAMFNIVENGGHVEKIQVKDVDNATDEGRRIFTGLKTDKADYGSTSQIPEKAGSFSKLEES